jgi:hypothetical protein
LTHLREIKWTYIVETLLENTDSRIERDVSGLDDKSALSSIQRVLLVEVDKVDTRNLNTSTIKSAEYLFDEIGSVHIQLTLPFNDFFSSIR